jgi:hypothetical protein
VASKLPPSDTAQQGNTADNGDDWQNRGTSRRFFVGRQKFFVMFDICRRTTFLGEFIIGRRFASGVMILMIIAVFAFMLVCLGAISFGHRKNS